MLRIVRLRNRQYTEEYTAMLSCLAGEVNFVCDTVSLTLELYARSGHRFTRLKIPSLSKPRNLYFRISQNVSHTPFRFFHNTSRTHRPVLLIPWLVKISNFDDCLRAPEFSFVSYDQKNHNVVKPL